MPSPFPGMDPYIECQGSWQDFHNGLVAEIRRTLAKGLPRGYVARFDERVEVVGYAADEGSQFKPEVLVARRPGADSERGMSPRTGATTIEPVAMDVHDRDLEEVHETWIEISRLPDMELVTVIEVLSPTNKAGPGRRDYLAKRQALHDRRVHLVEIDLLLGGHRLPMSRPLPPGNYFAIVARADELPKADVYAWSIRDRLPTIPVPLKSPDPEMAVALSALTDTVYEDGRYDQTLRYDRRLPDGIPLHPEDRAWAEAVASGREPL